MKEIRAILETLYMGELNLDEAELMIARIMGRLCDNCETGKKERTSWSPTEQTKDEKVS